MSRVVDFPNLPRVGSTTPPGREVVVAPLGEEVVAWVRVGNKALILERTPNWEHAVRDGRAYADRHSIPFRFQSIAFTTDQWDRRPQIQGEIYLAPSERDGGSWDVVHVSASGDTAATLGNAFSYDEADAMARRLAKEMGAAVHGNEPAPTTDKAPTLDATVAQAAPPRTRESPRHDGRRNHALRQDHRSPGRGSRARA